MLTEAFLTQALERQQNAHTELRGLCAGKRWMANNSVIFPEWPNRPQEKCTRD